MRPTGACVGVTLRGRVRDIRHRVVDRGCPGRDLHGDLLGARRAGPAHERRARRPAAARPAGLPEGAGERRRRPPTPTAVSPCGWIPARRARPTRRSPASSIRSDGQVVAQCAADGICPPIAAPNGEQRTYEAVRRQRASASRGRACAPSRGRTTRRRRRPRVDRAPGRHRRRGRRRRAARSTASTRPRPAASRSRAPPARRCGCRSAPSQTSARGAVVPRRARTPRRRSPSRPFSRFDLPPGLGGSASGARRHGRRATASARRSDAAAHADLGVRRRRHLDGHRPRRGACRAATARRCATASSARAAAARPTPSGATATFPALRGRRGVPLHAVRRVLVRRRVVRPRRRRRESVRARAVRAARRRGGPSPSTPTPERRRPACRVDHPRRTRPRASALPNHNRVEFARLGPRHDRLRPRSRHPGALRAPGVGHRHAVGDA